MLILSKIVTHSYTTAKSCACQRRIFSLSTVDLDPKKRSKSLASMALSPRASTPGEGALNAPAAYGRARNVPQTRTHFIELLPWHCAGSSCCDKTECRSSRAGRAGRARRTTSVENERHRWRANAIAGDRIFAGELRSDRSRSFPVCRRSGCWSLPTPPSRTTRS